MFDADFLDSLAASVANKVIERIESRKDDQLARWVALYGYGPVMTREEVCAALKISKRYAIMLENKGKLVRADIPGKEAKYDTAHVFELVTKR